MRSNAAVYPQSYYQILLMLPEDGTPKIVPFRSRLEAEDFRFDYYNFLKWCRRPKNLHAAAHLQGRYNQVSVKLVDNTLHFALRTNKRFEAIDNALTAMFRAEGIEPPPVPLEFTQPTRSLPKGEAYPLGMPPTEDHYALPTFDEPAVPIPPYTPASEALPPHIMPPPVRTKAEELPPHVIDDRLIPPGAPKDLSAFFKAGFAPGELEREAQNRFELQAQVAEDIRLGNVPKRVGWFANDAKVELDAADRTNPRMLLGRALDTLIFDGLPTTISYPVDPANPHEISERLITKHFQAYSDILLETGLDHWIVIERNDAGFVFSLLPRAEEMLHVCNYPEVRRQHTVQWKDRNAARTEINALFKEHQQ